MRRAPPSWDLLSTHYIALPPTSAEDAAEEEGDICTPVVPCYGRDRLLRNIAKSEQAVLQNNFPGASALVVRDNLPWVSPEHEYKLLRDASCRVRLRSGKHALPIPCANGAQCVVHLFSSFRDAHLKRPDTQLWGALTPEELEVFMRTGQGPKSARGAPLERPCILCCRYEIGVESCAAALGRRAESSQWYKNTVGVEGGYARAVCAPSAGGSAENVLAPIALLHCDLLRWRIDPEDVPYLDQSAMYHGCQHFR